MRGAEPFKRNLARRLRTASTDAEHKLWLALRDRRLQGLKFRGQHPEPPYTLDFFCAEARLVVEVDGGQHGGPRDERRTAVLEGLGLAVLRFWNNEVLLNLEGCLEVIAQTALERVESFQREAESGLQQRARAAYPSSCRSCLGVLA